MTDYSKLKAFALAATPSKWTTDGEKTVMSAESDQLNSGYAVVECHGPDALKNSKYIAAASPVVVLRLIAELELLQTENERRRMRIKEIDLLFGRYILAMRSALIEEEHGKGPAAGMEWIYNSLAGPGELPPEGETDSQAYFDREIVAIDRGMEEVMAFLDLRRQPVSKEASNG